MVQNGPYRTGSHRPGSSSSRASFISIHAHSREQTRPKAAAPPVVSGARGISGIVETMIIVSGFASNVVKLYRIILHELVSLQLLTAVKCPFPVTIQTSERRP